MTDAKIQSLKYETKFYDDFSDIVRVIFNLLDDDDNILSMQDNNMLFMIVNKGDLEHVKNLFEKSVILRIENGCLFLPGLKIKPGFHQFLTGCPDEMINGDPLRG